MAPPYGGFILQEPGFFLLGWSSYCEIERDRASEIERRAASGFILSRIVSIFFHFDYWSVAARS